MKSRLLDRSVVLRWYMKEVMVRNIIVKRTKRTCITSEPPWVP